MQDLEELGMEHLVGSNLLRAYMHGFFMDMKLYSKAKSAADPHTFEQYRRDKVKQKLADEKTNRVQLLNALPKVNRRLAAKILQKKQQSIASKSETGRPTAMEDSRFKAMFENPDFETKND